MVVVIEYRNNELMESTGDTYTQIILDLENRLNDLKKYQTEHLDKLVKPTNHPSYSKWTGENMARIEYLERMIQLVNYGKYYENEQSREKMAQEPDDEL